MKTIDAIRPTNHDFPARLPASPDDLTDQDRIRAKLRAVVLVRQKGRTEALRAAIERYDESRNCWGQTFASAVYDAIQNPPVCGYCEDRPAEGYVSAYDALVCQECYEDHHGPAL